MTLQRLPFNLLVFFGLGFQYALMHFFSRGDDISIGMAELILFLLFTVFSLFWMFRHGHRIRGKEAVSSSFPLAMSVLWSVALYTHFRHDHYPAELQLLSLFGVVSAFAVLLYILFFVITD